MPLAQRRVCGLCGRAYAIVLPPDEPERARDKLCPDCARLPPPPDELETWGAIGSPTLSAYRWTVRRRALPLSLPRRIATHRALQRSPRAASRADSWH